MTACKAAAAAILIQAIAICIIFAFVRVWVRVASKKGVHMSRYQLAQINIATLKAPLDSPELKDFVDNLDLVNGIAEASEGFVWRLKGDGNDATTLRPFGEDIIVNMSVWRDIESLRQFAYGNAKHVEILKRKREWFTRMKDAYMVLWWVPAGHQPTLQEAAQRLELLRQKGPTADAFHFGEAFSAPDSEQGGAPFSFKDTCPA